MQLVPDISLRDLLSRHGMLAGGTHTAAYSVLNKQLATACLAEAIMSL